MDDPSISDDPSPSQASSPEANQLPHAQASSSGVSLELTSAVANGATPKAGSTQLVVSGQQVSAIDGGLAIGDSTLRVGGDPVTVSSVVYSAATGGGLVVISDSYALAHDPSPTDAYQVL